MQVFDDIVTESQANEIEKLIIHGDWPWYIGGDDKYGWEGGTVAPEETEKYMAIDKNVKEHIQMVHTLIYYDDVKELSTINSSEAERIVELLNPLIKRIGAQDGTIFRLKANLTTQYKESLPGTYSTPHNDISKKHMVVIYYVNDSDGDTFVFDDDGKIIKRVSPKKGRFFMFDGRLKHAGSHPYDNTMRVVINFNVEFF